MNFREYIANPQMKKDAINEAMVGMDQILKKAGGKDYKMSDETLEVKMKMFGAFCMAIGPQLESGRSRLKKEQINKIIELLESIKKEL